MINSNIHYWSNNFNITTIIASFYNEFKEKMGYNFPIENEINLFVFDRKYENKLSLFYDNLLTGWLPNKNNEKTEYDFALFPDNIAGIPVDFIFNFLISIGLENEVLYLHIKLQKDEEGLIQVIISI